MVRVTLFTVAVLLLMSAAGTGSGSPIAGKHSLGRQKIPERTKVRLEKRYRGGERACVIVKGDHDPVVDLGVYVYDDKDNLIAKDEAGGDFVSVMWYPPREGVYRIEILNPGQTYNDCYISLK